VPILRDSGEPGTADTYDLLVGNGYYTGEDRPPVPLGELEAHLSLRHVGKRQAHVDPLAEREVVSLAASAHSGIGELNDAPAIIGLEYHRVEHATHASGEHCSLDGGDDPPAVLLRSPVRPLHRLRQFG
jgi:hypothetical protein